MDKASVADLTTDDLQRELVRRDCAEHEHLPKRIRIPLVRAGDAPVEVGCDCGDVTWVRQDRPLPALSEVRVEIDRHGAVTVIDGQTGKRLAEIVRPWRGKSRLNGLFFAPQA